MPAQKTSTRRPSQTTKPRRNPMACKSCRERKVKCHSREDQHGRRCERCIKEDLECHYVPVAEHMPQYRDQALSLNQGSFDAGIAGTLSPDGATQGIPGTTYQWSHALQNNSLYDAAPRQRIDISVSAHDTTPVSHSDIAYGTSSVYEQDYQQRMEDTHDGSQSVSDSHAVNRWPGQVHEGSRYGQPDFHHHLQYPSSSNMDYFLGHSDDAIAPMSSETSFSSTNHSATDVCVFPNYYTIFTQEGQQRL
ncbi:hypothetical protein FPV67DRAFT_408634 [Lyophyllum atratum]|nr:hypothetical protein FPV67DRAFT_408634 [Lyophyllum atratum]